MSKLHFIKSKRTGKVWSRLEMYNFFIIIMKNWNTSKIYWSVDNSLQLDKNELLSTKIEFFFSSWICMKVFLEFWWETILKHSSEIRGLCSMNCSSETLQNLLYFMYKKTHVVFFVVHFRQLYFFPYECRHARNEQGKKLHGFS